MKCNEAEKSILLQDSAELGARKIRDLEAHLSACESCRNFKQAMAETMSAFNATREPSAKVVYDVLRAARLNAPVKKHHIPVYGLKPSLAAVATVLIGLGIFLSVYRSNKVGMDMVVSEAQLLTPSDQVVSVMYDGLSEDDLAFNFLMTYEGNGKEG